MMPIVDGLETEFNGRVTVARLNAGNPENERLQFSYVSRGHPSFVVLDEAGNVTSRFSGPQTAETLAAAMNAVAPAKP